ncbi:MAG TPA: YjbE family putative metal transport protein, partial [Acidobacteriaceae bacterium]|nr:YjbE family putative metal transport protein [Acidobacteriaceae bacterium]
QRRAVAWGSGAAVAMRILLTLFALALLQLPYLKLVGAALLLWIGVRLLLPEDDGADIDGHENLLAAIKTILIADLVMSLDNVVAVAAAAGDNVTLLILGLAISIPLVIFGSTLLLKVMERFPIIVTAGGALLGFVAGGMAVDDVALGGWMKANFQMLENKPILAGFHLELIVGLIGALLVVLVGKWLARKSSVPSEIDHVQHAGK